MNSIRAHSPGSETFPPHPRKIGWLGVASLAMGGSNQSLFIMSALFVGQGAITGQGSAAIPLLMLGLLLSYMAMPGWTELCCMFPNRVGGIAATCSEAFRPYSPILANLTGVCYWWGWVPTCGYTALLAAGAIQQWYFPNYAYIHCLPPSALSFVHGIPEWLLAGASTMEGLPTVPLMAAAFVMIFAWVNLMGMQLIARFAVAIATVSAILAFLSGLIPVITGHVDWHQATNFSLTTPFPGVFGTITSAMAGLYLIGFAAPAFEAVYCHVGEMKDPDKNVPKAARMSAIMAGLYFAILPMIWLGCLGSGELGKELSQVLGPTFAPLFGSAAKSVAVWFMVFNMFHGTMAPTAGVCRTLSQLADDGLLPRIFSKRNRHDAPYVAALFTAGCAIVFLLMGDPIWLIAAANMTYLIGISLPSVAVWLLRRDAPTMHRPYRARRGMITLGLVAAIGWGISTVLGFQQFGLPTVLFGVGLAYSGAVLYAWRQWSDRRRAGLSGITPSLHIKLTGAMLLVLVLDAAGYLLAVNSIPANSHPAFMAILADIFVAVALLTIGVGLVLPGMIANSAVEVSKAAKRLVEGTLADFTRAMESLAAGRLSDAHARIDIEPVLVNSRDELGEMATSFNTLQNEIRRAAIGLDGAREGLRSAREELTALNAELEQRVNDRTTELQSTHARLVEVARRAGKAEIATSVLHNVGNVLNSVNVSAGVVSEQLQRSAVDKLTRAVGMISERKSDIGEFFAHDEKGKQVPAYLEMVTKMLQGETATAIEEMQTLCKSIEHIKRVINAQQDNANAPAIVEDVSISSLLEDAIRVSIFPPESDSIQIETDYHEIPIVQSDRHVILQIFINLVGNAKHALRASNQDHKKIILRVVEEECEGATWVRIEVIDNGVGIPSENLARIFNHGFTTKKEGHGFGLHASANSIHQLGGSLKVHSDGPGCGATFIVKLPVKAVINGV